MPLIVPGSGPRWRGPFRWVARLLVAGAVLGGLEGASIAVDGLRDRPGRADVALVLGNTVEPDGQPSARLRARLDRAVEQYRQGDYPFIIVSGGVEPNGYDEAAVMRAYLVAQNVPAGRIIADSRGDNTYASARFTARLMRERDWKSACVVTQFFHVSRTRLALRRFGVGTVYSAHARYFERRDAYSLLREMVGLVEYAMRSYDDRAGQAAAPPARS